MSVDLTYGLRYRQSSPEFPVGRYFKFKVEGSLEGQFGYRYATDSVSFSAGTTGTLSPTEVTTETTATVSQELYTACEDSIKVSIEEKLGDLFDFMVGHSDKTAEQILAEVTSINVTWQGARGGSWEHTSISASMAPFALFVNEATFMTVQIQERFDRTLVELGHSSILVSGIFSCSVPISVTPAGVIRISQIFYTTAARAVNLTLRVGSWISRTFAATGVTGEAVVVGGTVVGGALAGAAVSTAFCMWLIDEAHRAGVARGLTNQMASGFVRYLFDREHIFANLTERRGDRYHARVRGGNLAYHDIQLTSEHVVKEIWKMNLFPERTHTSDSYVRGNLDIAIDRMTLILEASGEGYHA